MPFTVILHVQSEEAVVGEVEELPKPTDNLVVVSNPHRLDGKELRYLSEEVVTVMWPVHRINFIEVLPGKEEEQIIGFVRE